MKLPKDWEYTQLKSVINDFIVPMRDKPKDLTGPIPWCRIEDFNGKYLINSKSNQGVSEGTVSKMNLKIYPINTVLVSCSANLGKCAIVKKPLLTNQTFIGLVPSEKICEEFLYYIMGFNEVKLNVLSSGTTISYLSRKEFENLKVLIPNKLAEQQKIAAILSKWDELIDTQTQLIKVKEKQKNSLMQKLLTGEMRFPGFEEKWGKCCLRDISSLITKGTTPTSLGFNFETEGVNFIKAENINNFGEIVIDSTPKISEECNVKLKRSQLKVNDIVFSIAGTLGRTAIIQEKDLPANTNQALAIIRLKDAEPHFVNFCLNTPNIEKYIKEMVSVGAQPNINLEQVNEIVIPVPSIKEQIKITEILYKMELEIKQLKIELKAIKLQKKGLMQQLLTGKIRLKV